MADEPENQPKEESEETPAEVPADTAPTSAGDALILNDDDDLGCLCPGSNPEPEEAVIEEVPTSSTQETQQSNALSSEFLYYSSVLKIIAPSLTSQADKENVIPWIRKLFRPEYQSTHLREKRNRYLIYLTISLLNDELSGVFTNEPDEGNLPELGALPETEIEAASWERDKMWQETLQTLPETFQPLDCSVHSCKEECKTDHKLDRILDQEFQFFLYLARPYATLMLSCDDRTKIACWIQTLCTIQGKCCSSMKAIRNDYMMALLGYVHDLRAVGPFGEKPPWRTLQPLAEAAKESFDNYPMTDPTGPAANEFLMDQPVPDDGAFCYIALSGDLIQSSFGGPSG